jgi:hypothetical protein
MALSSRTAIELEQMIVAQVRANGACRDGLTVKVVRVDDRWDAFPGPIDRESYPDCVAVVTRVASELRAEYDLAE